LCGLFGVKNCEGRYLSTVVDIVASRLEKTANKDDLKKCIGIFKKIKSRSCLNKLCCVSFKIPLRDSFEVLVELVSEDCAMSAVKQEAGGTY